MCCRNTIIFHTNFPWMEMFLMAMSDYYWSSPAIVMHIPYWPGYPRHSPRQNINRRRQTFPDMWGRGGGRQHKQCVTAWRVTWQDLRDTKPKCISQAGQLTFFEFEVWDSFALFTHLQPVIDRFISRNVIHSHQAVIKKFGQFSQRLHLNF